MARIRTIKPEFWTDEKVVELTPWARLLFLGLLNFADDEGRLVHSPKRIKMQILPADSVSIQVVLTELKEAGFIFFYTVDSSEYLQIRNFTKHQKVNRPSHSNLPAPPDSLSDNGVLSEGSQRERKGMEGKKTDSSLRSESPVLDLRSSPEDSGSTTSVKELQGKSVGARAFDAYALAYRARYGVAPVANAKVRGQFSNLVKALGEDAVAVAAFYPTHNRQLYVDSTHDVGLLLRDAAGLLTQLRTGKTTSGRKLSAAETVREAGRARDLKLLERQ